VGHCQSAHRHQHRIDVTLADSATGQVIDDAAEERGVDGVIVQVEETWQNNTAVNVNRFTVDGRMCGYVGNAEGPEVVGRVQMMMLNRLALETFMSRK
jgi:hypothetical protein